MLIRASFFFFVKQRTAYEIMPSLVGSEMCRRDSESERAAKLSDENVRTAALERESMRARLTELAAGWYGETGKHVDMLEKLAQLDGEGGDSFQFYVTTQNALAEQVRAGDLLKEKGTDKAGQFGNATEQANKLAALRVKEEGISFGVALERVFQEQPALYGQYVREVSRKAGA